MSLVPCVRCGRDDYPSGGYHKIDGHGYQMLCTRCCDEVLSEYVDKMGKELEWAIKMEEEE